MLKKLIQIEVGLLLWGIKRILAAGGDLPPPEAELPEEAVRRIQEERLFYDNYTIRSAPIICREPGAQHGVSCLPEES